MKWAKQTNGFTIVELLIVIVVIGILAAITIVAFNGVQNRAKTAAVQSSVTQAMKKILAYAAQNSDQYPTALADVDVKDGVNGMTYQYTSDNTVSPRKFYVTATAGSISYYLSYKNEGLKEGIAPGQNLLVWDKSQGTTSMPVPTAINDTSVFRTSTSSMRIDANLPGRSLLGSNYTGTIGQRYTVSFWLKTDSNWNGQINNSKIRFGSAATSAALTSCSYNAIRLTWTFVTCGHTLTADLPVTISVGNDGTVGSIWLDDFSLSLSE